MVNRPPARDGDAPARTGATAAALAAAVAEAELRDAPTDVQAAPGSRHGRLLAAAAVGLGGVLGANARYFAGLWAAAHWGAGFPWGTLAINASGSFALGLYLTLATERFAGRSATRLFVATGFLGSYTTFSTFSMDAVDLLRQGAAGPAAAYVAMSLGACLAAVVAGSAVARGR